MSVLNCTAKGTEEVVCNGILYAIPEQPLTYKDNLFWIYVGVYVFLVLFAGKEVIYKLLSHPCC